MVTALSQKELFDGVHSYFSKNLKNIILSDIRLKEYVVNYAEVVKRSTSGATFYLARKKMKSIMVHKTKAISNNGVWFFGHWLINVLYKRWIEIFSNEIFSHQERDTACCLREDQAGCVQTQKSECKSADGHNPPRTESLSKLGPHKWVK